jgi:putative protease
VQARRLDILLRGSLPHGREGKSGIKPGTVQGIWLSPKALTEVSRTLYNRISWWLPPVIWPDEEENWLKLARQAQRNGARHFVCNAPWQVALFDDLRGLALSAGPFCNITNGYAIGVLKEMGFASVIVSPELSGEDYRSLPGQSPLPLGIVISGYLPMGLTRHGIDPLKQREFWYSPKREGFWTKRYGQNFWLYPAWPLDLQAHAPALEKAGYSTFVQVAEFPPKSVEKGSRTGEFNWNTGVQ